MMVPPTDGGTDAVRDAGVTVTEAATEFGGADDGPDMQTMLLAGGALLAGITAAYVARGGI